MQVLINKPGNLPYLPDVMSLVVEKYFEISLGQKWKSS